MDQRAAFTSQLTEDLKLIKDTPQFSGIASEAAVAMNSGSKFLTKASKI